MDSEIKTKLEKILTDLNRIEGIESSLIADSNGDILSHTMSRSADITLFGSMAHVISGSSERLLNSANQGKIERVLVESKRGKALFLHLGNVYFTILMDVRANVGFVMVSAKRAAAEIVELTKDWIPVEIIPEISVPEKTEIDKRIETEDISKEEAAEIVEELVETEGVKEAFSKVTGTEDVKEMLESEEVKALNSKEAEEELSKILEVEPSAEVSEEIKEEISEIPEIKEEIDKVGIEDVSPQEGIEKVEPQKEIEEVPKSSAPLPVIRPPISFPKLPEDVAIPSGDKEKSDLILDIYEAIFLAMSIGASKIMGVAPARGLIQRFLPIEDCKSILNDVNVKSNSAIDFDKIRENSEGIPLNEREDALINSFSKIIDIITENYGQVMGYSAFRGIVRTEFGVINASYGEAMNELGIKDKVHPELKELFK